MLLILLVAAVASILRTGRGLLDRLMVGTLVVAGALVAGGLLFSLWPWGLRPFPVAGFLFTVVALVGWASGRRPSLPRSCSVSDLMVLGPGAFVAFAMLRPALRRPLSARWMFTAPSEDRAAHFTLFDAIHHIQSYPFLSQVAARTQVQTPTEAAYPQGSHFLYAMVDVFARSTPDAGPAFEAFNRYFLLNLAGFAFLIIAAVWAARWILTPLVGGWRLIAATAAVAALLLGGRTMDLPALGSDSQILGIAFVCLTVALAIRPPCRLGDRIVLLGAGVILVSYTYFLYLPVVGIAVLASFAVDRRLLVRHWRQIGAGAVVIGAVAAVPLIFFVAHTSVEYQALVKGAALKNSPATMAATTVASLAVLVTGSAWRLRRNRTIALFTVATAAGIALFAMYQEMKIGTTSYYLDKLTNVYLVVTIVCSATLATLLKPLSPAVSRTGWVRVREVALGGVLVVLAFTSVVRFGVGPRPSDVLTPEWKATGLGRLYNGFAMREEAAVAAAHLEELQNRRLLGDGVSTIFLISNNAYINWRVTSLNGIMNRTSGVTAQVVNRVLAVPFGGTPVDSASGQQALAGLETALAHGTTPMRIVVRDQVAGQAIQRMLQAHPEFAATVVVLR